MIPHSVTGLTGISMRRNAINLVITSQLKRLLGNVSTLGHFGNKGSKSLRTVNDRNKVEGGAMRNLRVINGGLNARQEVNKFQRKEV